MKLYSDYPAQLTRQIVIDLIAVLLIWFWVRLGMNLHDRIMELSGFGVEMEEAGAGLKANLTGIGNTLGGVPLVGDGIRVPFDAASDAAASLEQAGVSQQEAVADLATGIGLTVAGFPILAILLMWLVPRLFFARRAGRMKNLVESNVGLDLLALRAITLQRPRDLMEVVEDPAGAWRSGDPVALRALASLELRSSGVRMKAPAGDRGAPALE